MMSFIYLIFCLIILSLHHVQAKDPEIINNYRPVTLPWWHPNVQIFATTSINQRTYTVPAGHPNINTYINTMVRDHDDVDASDRLPGGHPNLNSFFPLATKPSPITNITIGFYHPNIDTYYKNGIAVSINHPKIHPLMSSILPQNHPNIDTLLANPIAKPLPAWHPSLETLIASRRPPIKFTTSVPSYHPNISIAFPTLTMRNHPPVHSIFAAVLPQAHPNIDTIISNPKANPLPSYHPPINNYITYDGTKSFKSNITIGFYHPNIDMNYHAGVAVSINHPKIHPLMSAVLPINHTNIDTLLSNPKTYPLPNWHPSLETIIASRRPPVKFTTSVASYHPNISIAFPTNLTMRNHPPVQSIFAAVLPQAHPNIDMIITNPSANPLPSYHPPINTYITYDGTSTYKTNITVGYYHPHIDEYYTAGTPVSINHPKIHPLIASSLPSSHIDIDMILANPGKYPLPTWHPKLNELIGRRPPISFTIAVPRWHPNVETTFQLNQTYIRHPSIHTKFVSYLPQGHPNIDISIANPAANPLPSYHPPIGNYIKYDGNGLNIPVISVAQDHPNIDKSYAAGMSLPSDHPYLMSLLGDSLPPNHINLATIFANTAAYPLPSWHPSLESMITRRSNISPGIILSIMMTCWFMIAACIRLILKYRKYKKHMAWNFVMEQMRLSARKDHNRQPSHFGTEHDINYKSNPVLALTDVEMEIEMKQDQTRISNGSKGSERPFTLHAMSSTSRLPPPLPPRPPKVDFGFRDYHQRGASKWGPPIPTDGPLPARDRTIHHAQVLHQQHKGPSYYDASDIAATPSPSMNVTVEKYDNDKTTKLLQQNLGKKSSLWKVIWRMITMTRIPKTMWTTGNLLFLSMFILLNGIAIGIATRYSGYTWDRSFGSLAAANAMFLIIPATRNNVLTWVLGKPFDHVVLYHRFMGRLTITISSIHFIMYAKRFFAEYNTSYTYVTGMCALACGYMIFLTTINWIRRNKFTIFFWAHYSFVGFFALAFAHHRMARPFLLVGIALYALDRLIRVFLMYLPRRCMMFRIRGDAIAQVRFPKNPITEWGGFHKVGQYFFVNFPHLSLTEWHPFSVSSGPHDDHVELHIRALGDHTKEIVKYAKECSEKGYLPWIRMDGPYGVHDFNYRRYQTLFLVGGGVGITPISGMIKDIYLSSYQHSQHHCMSTVYVIWVMPDGKEADVFRELLDECMRVADKSDDLPSLVVYIYCTRAKPGSVQAPLIAGRPNFPQLMDAATNDSITSSGSDNKIPLSTLVFACGPSMMVNQLWDECNRRHSKQNRVDFHHETFEF